MSSAGPDPLSVRLRVDGWPCLVVGGGRVGTRRARRLAAAGASVRVVDPSPDPTLADDGIELERRRYRPGDVDGARLVVCATGVAEVDTAVADDAARAGALVNDATSGGDGDLTFVVTGRIGPTTVTLDTGGQSPAVARWLLTRLDHEHGGAVRELVEMATEARRDLLDRTGQSRHPQWDAACDRAWELIGEGRSSDARLALRQMLGL